MARAGEQRARGIPVPAKRGNLGRQRGAPRPGGCAPRPGQVDRVVGAVLGPGAFVDLRDAVEPPVPMRRLDRVPPIPSSFQPLMARPPPAR
jgi:hypothetical protein